MAQANKKLRICAECVHSHTESVQTPQGYARIMICKHDMCRDLVSGETIACGTARRETVYCGPGGQYYERRPEEPVLKEVKKESASPLILSLEDKK